MSSPQRALWIRVRKYRISEHKQCAPHIPLLSNRTPAA